MGSVEERPFSASTAHPPALSFLSSLLSTWLNQYSEDFLQPADSPCLKLLVAHGQVHLPGSALEHQAIVLFQRGVILNPLRQTPCAQGGSTRACRVGARTGPHRQDLPEIALGPGARRSLRQVTWETAVWEHLFRLDIALEIVRSSLYLKDT